MTANHNTKCEESVIKRVPWKKPNLNIISSRETSGVGTTTIEGSMGFIES